MRAQIMAAGVLFVVAGAYPVFGQALAEGALVHANSAAATAKAGTALGNALNNATTHIGQQMHTVTQTHVAGSPQSTPHTTAAVSGTSGSAAASSSSNSGALTITSIKGGQPATKGSGQPSTNGGGQPICAPAPTKAAGNKAASGAGTQAQPCSSSANTPTQSKSVVHLSFPQ